MSAILTILGRATRDPEMQQGKNSGTEYVSLDIAVSQRGQDGKEETIYYQCYFNKFLAERLAKAGVKKGTGLMIYGDSLIGKPLLMELVGDLQARGYEKLFINEQGDVYILNGTEPEVRGKLEHFPPKDYWGELTEIFTEDELTTEETEQALELSWIS